MKLFILLNLCLFYVISYYLNLEFGNLNEMRLKGLNSFKIIFTLVQSVLFNTNLLFCLRSYYKKNTQSGLK